MLGNEDRYEIFVSPRQGLSTRRSWAYITTHDDDSVLATLFSFFSGHTNLNGSFDVLGEKSELYLGVNKSWMRNKTVSSFSEMLGLIMDCYYELRFRSQYGCKQHVLTNSPIAIFKMLWFYSMVGKFILF